MQSGHSKKKTIPSKSISKADAKETPNAKTKQKRLQGACETIKIYIKS